MTTGLSVQVMSHFLFGLLFSYPFGYLTALASTERGGKIFGWQFQPAAALAAWILIVAENGEANQCSQNNF